MWTIPGSGRIDDRPDLWPGAHPISGMLRDAVDERDPTADYYAYVLDGMNEPLAAIAFAGRMTEHEARVRIERQFRTMTGGLSRRQWARRQRRCRIAPDRPGPHGWSVVSIAWACISLGWLCLAIYHLHRALG